MQSESDERHGKRRAHDDSTESEQHAEKRAAVSSREIARTFSASLIGTMSRYQK